MTAAGCDPGATPSASSAAGTPADLVGTAWQLVRIGDAEPPKSAQVTIAFAPADVTGFGGCNSFGGSYQADPATGALTFGPIRSTKRACLEQALSDLEFRFLGALGDTTNATTDADGGLVLSGAGPVLIFAPTAGG